MVSVTLVGLVVVVVVATFSIRIAFGSTPTGWYALGFVHAFAICAFVGLLLSAFHVHEADAIRQVRGAWGEDNTRDELVRAKRRGLIWGSVDSITMGTGDIDHLVVTRRGGLVAIDSKWRTSERPQDAVEMKNSASRARIRAQGVLTSLLPAENGQHRSRGPAHRVTPLVVVWGKAQHALTDGAAVDGVEFVPGRSLRTWLAALEGETIDRRAGKDLLRRLEAVRDETWKHLDASNAIK